MLFTVTHTQCSYNLSATSRRYLLFFFVSYDLIPYFPCFPLYVLFPYTVPLI